MIEEKTKKLSSIQIIIASKNVHKIREIKAILNPIEYLDVLSLCNFPKYIPPEETGTNFLENAKIKALSAAKALNQWVLAEDSGLIVPALKGDPGVFSARYAGNEASDADNRKKLLENMQSLLDQDRSAYFECCMVLASPDGIKKTVTANCEGEILTKERGGGGFGYDPVFIKNNYNKSFGELEESIKNRISHRRKAIDKLLFEIESIIK